MIIEEFMKVFYRMGFVNLHYIPIYKHPFYKKFGFDPKDFKNSEYYYKHAITLPIHPKLKNSEQLKIIKCLKKALKKVW